MAVVAIRGGEEPSPPALLFGSRSTRSCENPNGAITRPSTCAQRSAVLRMRVRQGQVSLCGT